MTIRTDYRNGSFLTVATLLLLTFVWVIAWYWSTAEQVAGIWLRSDTFAHGLVVLPIFIWLVWRKRETIAPLTPQPLPWMALPVAAMGFAWLLGRMVSVDGLSHFALFGMVVLTFAGVLGLRLSRVLLFPLLFLFFGLPIGEFLLPTLMHYTAEFTVIALRLSGIPVYQEGLYFVIPNGRWSVVEACSGLRYLAASLFVGALYAYLNYVSLKRRLLFMLVALIVPIVANWVRAYLTVMVGYHFGSEFVQGFIHIVYGWVFFGVVIVIMFSIGALWREEPRPVGPSHVEITLSGPDSRRWLGIVPVALVVAAFPLLLDVIEDPVEPFSVALAAPSAAPGWQAVDDDVLGYLPNYNGHRGELFQAYRRESDGATVGLYMAYYARQREDAEMIAWQNRLTGRVDAGRWAPVRIARDRMPVGPVNLGLLRQDDTTRMAVWHWFWSNEKVISSEVIAKVNLAVDQLIVRRDDAAFVAVFAPYIYGPDEVRPLVEEFVGAHTADIEAVLLDVEFDR